MGGPPELGTRALGAALAAAMGGIGVLAQAAYGVLIDVQPGSLIVPVTVPVGAVLGFRYAPAVSRQSSLRVRVLLVLAGEAVLMGALIIASIAAVSGLYGPPSAGLMEFAWTVIFYTGYGIMLLGLPLYLAAIGFAVIWAALTVRLVDRAPLSRKSRSRRQS